MSFAFSLVVDLTQVERRLARLQAQLIWYRGSVDHFVSHDVVVDYAAQLAKRYFPIRSNNAVYLEPVINAFSYDLVLAPMHHRCHHLWRYNYDDLDILAQFYRFSNDKHGYYHLAQGTLERPTGPLFEEGCRLLGIRIGDSEELFSTYYVEGARARVPARVIETIAGLPSDHELNGHYGFLEQESTKRSRKLAGAGRFRFLRRGRTWMALGTSPSARTHDIRREGGNEVFGYRIAVRDQEVQISVAKSVLAQARADIVAILESESTLSWRMKQLCDFYRRFHHQHRFVNANNWFELDQWISRRVSRLARSQPKHSNQLYLAGEHLPKVPTYLPRRSNFFWGIAEVNCPYSSLWNPHTWPQPDRDLPQIVPVKPAIINKEKQSNDKNHDPHTTEA